MTRTLPILGFLALGAQGCIIYTEGCQDCGWGDWESRWGGDSCGEATCEVDPDPEPEPIAAWLDPDFAERGQTFVAHLMFDGDIDAQQVLGARFSGGVQVRYAEPRAGDLLLLIDVPLSADLGPADLTLRVDGHGAISFPGALTIGEIGSGVGDEPCR